jgi:hypothetical protein
MCRPILSSPSVNIDIVPSKFSVDSTINSKKQTTKILDEKCDYLIEYCLTPTYSISAMFRTRQPPSKFCIYIRKMYTQFISLILFWHLMSLFRCNTDCYAFSKNQPINHMFDLQRYITPGLRLFPNSCIIQKYTTYLFTINWLVNCCVTPCDQYSWDQKWDALMGIWVNSLTTTRLMGNELFFNGKEL